MNKTVILNENYGKRLRDEIMGDPSNGLKGEVEIQVRNRDTGQIESQQKHNLIVYGGREWLLKKAFTTNVSSNPNFIRNSEILWFGIGCGGGEPGNPLQCGCTYGSDTDLYNPVRMRYEFNTNSVSSNPYYASRILPNGDIVNGYYKKITYVSIREDQANPYKVNKEIKYPKLIAELRLEVSPDDVCGQTFLGNDYEKSYADINEAALFIADNRYMDPGQQDNTLTYITQDYTSYNDNRRNMEPNQDLPRYEEDNDNLKYTWTENTPFPNLATQYFNIYLNSENNTDPLNSQPILMGIYKDGTSKTTGYIELDPETHMLAYHFENDGTESSGSLEVPEEVLVLSDLKIKSIGTIFIKAIKSTKLASDTDKPIQTCCNFRNTYKADYQQITEYVDSFETSNEYNYFLPVGYVFDRDAKEWVKNDSFILNSIIRVIQAIDFSEEGVIKEIITDPNTLQCKCYVDTQVIDKLSEGMSIYTYNDSNSLNKISSDNSATILSIYNAKSEYGEDTQERSYFIIERDGLVNEAYTDPEKYPDGGLDFRFYKLVKDTPYIMFNRVTFSTIRISKSRDIILVWRIYF